VVLKLGTAGRPDGVKNMIESDTRRHIRRQLPLARGQGF